jgi:acyl carrier protein
MMTHPEIYHGIRTLLKEKLRVEKNSPSDTANFIDDFGLARWELNLLLYNVEDHFNIRLEQGLEHELDTINQLAALIHKEKKKALEVAA